MHKQQSHASISALLDGNNVLLNTKDEIIQRVQSYYRGLYSPSITCAATRDTFLNFCSVILSPAQAKSLDKPFTAEEIQCAIMQISLNKAPGLDGLPIEFYRGYSRSLGDELVEMFNNVWLGGTLPESMQSAVITLLPKKGNLHDIKNWRPVSLLNTDYRILSKTLSNRLSCVMPSIIKSYQSCGVPGRSSDHLKLLLKLMEKFILEKGIKAAFVAYDFEKAFDRMDHKWLLRVLSKFGFGKRIINLISAIYQDACFQVQVNGILTDKIPLRRGVKQGCALSMMLFVLSLEPLLLCIHNSYAIEAVPIPMGPSNHIKSMAFADDHTVICNSLTSIVESRNIIYSFGLASGSKVNNNKTEILLFGNWHRDDIRQLGDLVKPAIKILGVWLGPKSDQITWQTNYQIVCNSLAPAPKTVFSLYDKKFYVEAFVFSKIWHTVICEFPPQRYANLIMAAIERYMLKFYTKNCKYVDSLYLLPSNGGFGLCNFELKSACLQLAFLCKAFTAQELPVWSYLANYYLGFHFRRHLQFLSSSRFPHKIDAISIFAKSIQTYNQICAINSQLLNNKVRAKSLYLFLTQNLGQNIKFIGLNVNFSQCIFNTFASLYQRQISFLTLNELLPTLSNVPYDGCYWCTLCNSGPIETCKHLLTECSYFSSVRRLISSKITQICGHKFPCPRN